MVSSFISRLVILIFGTLYPAYASYKAVRTKNVREYVKWMMYWIVFALFTCAETFTDLFLSFWFPFYYEIKIITVIYLLSPATKGSSILYRKFVHPVLTKREQEIDEYIAKAKEQGYYTMLNLGSKGVTYATSLIMQTAIKGGGGLVNHLRRSYSLSDLDEEQHLKRAIKNSDDVDGSYGEDPRLIRRQLPYSPRRTLPSPGQPGLYFPEVDVYQRPDEDYLSQIPSSEEISSGYSSADPLYYNMQQAKGDHLVRTASLGPSSRVRTRAATKNGLPKRGSLAEGGSSWAALEPHESQNENESDIQFNFPLSHSASCPFPYASFQHIVLPQYQQILKNVTQNHIFTFNNNSEYSLHTNKVPVGFENLFDSNLKSEASVKFIDSELSKENILHDSKSQSVEDFSEKNVKSDEVTNKTKEMVMIDEDNKDNKEKEMKDAEKAEKNILEIKIESENDRFDAPEKQLNERFGKYNKKPAPTPPTEGIGSAVKLGLTVDEEEAEFFTPNSSPKLERKHNSSSVDLTTEKNNSNLEAKNREFSESNLSVKAKKPKPKQKKGDFNIPKKLHMPKMTFSFWHQKNGKQASASESSSIASVEISGEKTKNADGLEYYIPLKDNASENN